MLNVNQITSMLAKLPDPALQKYAQMHRGDPYMLSLTVAESNRRKQMREQAQANTAVAQGRPESVVDQKIAELAAPQALPEEQGIARIPAGDMNFAGGGIVAFAEGGDIPRYQTGGPTRYPGLIQYGAPYGGAPLLGSTPPDTDAVLASLKRFWESISSDEPVRKAAAKKKYEDEMAKRMQPAAGVSRMDPKFYEMAEQDALSRADAKEGIGLPPAPVAPPAPLDGAAKVSTRTSASTAGGAGIAALDPLKALATAEAELAKRDDPAKAAREEAEALREGLAKENVSGLEAINKQFSDIYKGKRERLDKREGEIAKMKNEGLGMALLQAGAAMMTTPGNVGAAIGRGIDVGSKQYGAGIQRLRDAQEKLADARDRLEETEAARGETSAREMLKARMGVKSAQLENRDAQIKYVMERDKVNRETAAKVVDAQVRMYEGAQNRAAQVQAASISAAARQGSDNELGLAKLAEKTMSEIRDAAAKIYDPTKRGAFMQQELAKVLQTNHALAQYMGRAAGPGGAPAAGAAPSFRFNPATGQIEPVR
jgi:hypothetical protein